MANTCIPYTLGALTMNDMTPGVDTLMTEEVDGLDSVPLRRTKPPQGQGDGAILLTAKKMFRIATFRGFVAIKSVEWDLDQAGYQAAQDALCASWVSALEALENASATLSWASNSLTVYKDGGITFSGQEFGKKFVLSLYAPNPTIS